MILTINEFKKKLDKPGKEDIDVNNDGKVDKSDFYLLNKRRKIKKAMKDKKNENTGSFNYYNKSQEIYRLFNKLTYLIDEGYISYTLELNDATIEDVDYQLGLQGFELFKTQENFDKFINQCKAYLDAKINESVVTENTTDAYKQKFHDWQKWYDQSIVPARELIKTNLGKTQEIVDKLDADLVSKKHFTEDILYINGKLKDLVSSYPNTASVKESADGSEIKYSVRYEKEVDGEFDNFTKDFKEDELDAAIDFATRYYSAVDFEKKLPSGNYQYGFVNSDDKQLVVYDKYKNIK